VKAEDLMVGKFYVLRGGHVLRYTGQAYPDSRCGMFCPITDKNWAESPEPCGFSFLPEDAVREIRLPEDREFLETRRDQCAARQLRDEAAQMTLILKELEKTQDSLSNPQIPV
jgi:hypothetical protein